MSSGLRQQRLVDARIGPTPLAARLTGNPLLRFEGQAPFKTSVQDRTGRCDCPCIMEPIIDVGVPAISTVKFGDPSERTAVAVMRPLWPVRVPENITASWCLKLSVNVCKALSLLFSSRNGIPLQVIAARVPLT